MFSCDGCHSKFNRQGDLIQHLQKSENLLCATARESLQQKMRPVPGGRAFTPTQNPSKHHMTTPPATGPSSEWVEGHQTVQFEGDFFGNDYDDTDFPFPEDVPVGSDKVDVEERSIHSDSEDEDEGFSTAKTQTSGRSTTRASARDHQQPPDPRAPLVPPVTAAELPAEMDVDEDNRPNDHSFAPGGVSVEGHNRLKKAPVYVSKFGGQAGKPLTTSSIHGVAGYSRYVEQTGSHDNIWAPFNSQLEWEIVQWAKLRGPGATAFTELLEIEGVSHYCLNDYSSELRL